MSFFAVPSVKRLPWGLLGLVLNILPVSGVGSVLTGAKGGHRGTLVVGIVQVVLDVGMIVMLTTGAFWPILVLFAVWVWSVAWGVRIFLASGGAEAAATPSTANANATTRGKKKTRA